MEFHHTHCFLIWGIPCFTSSTLSLLKGLLSEFPLEAIYKYSFSCPSYYRWPCSLDFQSRLTILMCSCHWIALLPWLCTNNNPSYSTSVLNKLRSLVCIHHLFFLYLIVNGEEKKSSTFQVFYFQVGLIIRWKKKSGGICTRVSHQPYCYILINSGGKKIGVQIFAWLVSEIVTQSWRITSEKRNWWPCFYFKVMECRSNVTTFLENGKTPRDLLLHIYQLKWI